METSSKGISNYPSIIPPRYFEIETIRYNLLKYIIVFPFFNFSISNFIFYSNFECCTIYVIQITNKNFSWVDYKYNSNSVVIHNRDIEYFYFFTLNISLNCWIYQKIVQIKYFINKKACMRIPIYEYTYKQLFYYPVIFWIV